MNNQWTASSQNKMSQALHCYVASMCIVHTKHLTYCNHITSEESPLNLLEAWLGTKVIHCESFSIH